MTILLSKHIRLLVAICVSLLWLQQNIVVAQSSLPGTEFPSVDAIPTAGPEEAFATYEPETGNVYLSVGSGLNLVRVRILAPFNLTNLRADLRTEFTPWSSGEPGEIPFITFSDSGFSNTGTFLMGSLLPIDPSIRNAGQFASKYPGTEIFAQRAGQAAILSQFNVIGIPEPSTAVVLCAAGCGLIVRRRKF